MEDDFGVLAPPVALHSAAPEMLAAAWVLLRESLIVPGLASRAAKEAVASAVSAGNACPYCAMIHNSAFTVLGPGRHDRSAPELDGVVEWVMSVDQPGKPVDSRFPPEQFADLAGVAVLLHYLNRMVNVFLRDVPLPPVVPEVALPPVLWVLGRQMAAAARQVHLPGAALGLLPAADLPADLSWAAGNETVAQAYARACAAIDDAGARALPADIRSLVSDNLAQWRGGPRGISRVWVEELIAPLPADQRPVARLALLVAFASYQVDPGVIERCRQVGTDDRTLLELSSWAAMAAARRVGSLLPMGG
ncbi:carboxymuconolactone decarboxylase family protein [Micromonospora sp. Llam0]|uniref:carboxymuconolactone decarboxylase family protein n=1 Tax=Micromonospora sp. Llam0 TaxID=2485143 RepID=UPI0018F461E2|nr:carboxymuconolactone decarboxylase family protein [Micromonospora sp. Llam0]